MSPSTSFVPTRIRRGAAVRIIGYALPDDSALEIFTAHFLPAGADTYLGTDDLSHLTGRAAHFLGYAAARDLSRFAGNEVATNATRDIADEMRRIEDVQGCMC